MYFVGEKTKESERTNAHQTSQYKIPTNQQKTKDRQKKNQLTNKLVVSFRLLMRLLLVGVVGCCQRAWVLSIGVLGSCWRVLGLIGCSVVFEQFGYVVVSSEFMNQRRIAHTKQTNQPTKTNRPTINQPTKPINQQNQPTNQPTNC